MDIDELMWAPGMRWIFRGYAIAAAAAGVILFGWGTVVLGAWLGADLPGLPYFKASLIRVSGGILLAAACCVAAMDGIEDPRARRRALLWLGIGHALLLLVFISQQQAIWHSRLADGVILALLIAVFAFFFLWSGADVGAGPNPNNQMISLFGTAAPARENLEQRYRNQLRAATLQEERHRLARDLHDSVKQQIFAIQTAAATAQARFASDPEGARAAVEQVRASAREAMAEMEAMLDQLRAAPLETVGLVESLRKQCEALGYRTGAAVDFQVGAGLSGLALAPGAQESLFRLAQEALANIGRHARAAHVKVALFADLDFLRLTVEDDGHGFDPEQPARGMGISNMRSRAEEFGGTFELTSSPDRGTRVSTAIPLLPKFTVAEYNRRLIWYAAGAAIHFGLAAWQHSMTFLALALLWCVYVVRIAIGRSAALRRPEAVR